MKEITINEAFKLYSEECDDGAGGFSKAFNIWLEVNNYKLIKDENHKLIPITKDNPFKTQFKTSGQLKIEERYILLRNGVRLLISGNNRPNSCSLQRQKKRKISRLNNLHLN